jgi:hypothetical protein
VPISYRATLSFILFVRIPLKPPTTLGPVTSSEELLVSLLQVGLITKGLNRPRNKGPINFQLQTSVSEHFSTCKSPCHKPQQA